MGTVATQSTTVLNMMERFFEGGIRWARRTYCTDDGKRCLLGALEYVRCEAARGDDHAVEYLARAIDLRQLSRGLPLLGNSDVLTVMGFNDAYGRRFDEIAEVVRHAHQLAVMAAD
jgi:hypothetical protein